MPAVKPVRVWLSAVEAGESWKVTLPGWACWATFLQVKINCEPLFGVCLAKYHWSWKLLAHKARPSLHQNALKESWRMVNVKAALSVPAFIPCTANTCSGYKWIHEEFISFAVSGFCIPLLMFLSIEGYHSCFVLCCPSPSCALFLSLLQQSHLDIHKTPIKFSLPQLLQEQKNVCFTSQTFWCGGNRLYVKKMNSE